MRIKAGVRWQECTWHDAAWQDAMPQKLISRDVMWCDLAWYNYIIYYFTPLLEFLLLLFHGSVCVSLLKNPCFYKKKKEIRWMRIRENWNPKTFWSRRTSLLFEKLIQPQQHWPGSVSYFLPSLMKSVPFLEYLKIRNEKEWKKWMTHFSQHKGVI